MQNTPPSLPIEQVLHNTRISAATLGLALASLGEFTREVVQHCAMDEGLLHQLRERALLRIRDTEARGFTLQDEVKVIAGALAMLTQCLGGEDAGGESARDA